MSGWSGTCCAARRGWAASPIVGAAACQALALTLGSLSLVQPILVLELPFTLLIASAVARRRLPAIGWAASVMVAAGLGLGLAAAAPSGGGTEVSAGKWVLTLVAAVGAMAACVLAALPRPRGKARAAFFSSASAIGYALTATLMKAATDTFDRHGPGAFFASWQSTPSSRRARARCSCWPTPWSPARWSPRSPP
ncbi:hypothetical protein SRIMM317S_01302 [Streptomyces rimosus subsp. rimosus]